jgi:hypothetical protein
MIESINKIVVVDIIGVILVDGIKIWLKESMIGNFLKSNLQLIN